MKPLRGAEAKEIDQSQGNEGAAGTEKKTKVTGTPGRRRGMKGYGRKVLLPYREKKFIARSAVVIVVRRWSQAPLWHPRPSMFWIWW